MSEKAKAQGYELFEQAMKNYEQALQAGLKLQQESARWWMDLMERAGSPQEWQTKANELASESMTVVQKRIEENLKLLESSSRTSLDLLKKAMEAAKADTVSVAQNRVQDLWEASLEAMRTNATAIQQANTKWMESWIQIVPKAKSAARAATV